jgi:hypothetical protein
MAGVEVAHILETELRLAVVFADPRVEQIEHLGDMVTGVRALHDATGEPVAT